MKRSLLIILVVPLILFGQFAKKGISGAKFLNVGIGTRAVGMAEAFSAVGDNAEAVYWNPAGSSNTPGTSIFMDRVNHWAGIGINSISITQSVGFAGVFGFFYSGLSSGEMEKTTAQQPQGTNFYFDYNAFQSGISYSRFLTDRFSFGVNLKMVREDYPDEEMNSHDATCFAMDVGGYYKTTFRDLRIGIVMQDFGPDVTPSGRHPDWADGNIVSQDEEFAPYPLPITFRGGVAFSIYTTEQIEALLAFDLIHPSDNLERYAIGTEVTILDILKLRTGYQLGGGIDDHVNAFNFGLGISQSTTSGKFEFGYSYTYGNKMPAIHRVSLLMGL